ncbi:hypothetical protein [Flagellimonas sp. CMM7]|nr:hypothetical protein [Flagellimonas sp. CMM7]
MKEEVVAEVSHKNQNSLQFDYQIINIKTMTFCKDLAQKLTS